MRKSYGNPAEQDACCTGNAPWATVRSARSAFGEQLIEELPKKFRCASVDPLTRQNVVHRRGQLADVLSCVLELPLLYAPMGRMTRRRRHAG
ncbi:hypothetical protein [Mycobacterium lepromatosis]|uniref:hypothetical protein n=1 Tax=Mycobacterium lepromatosis TaxID=480418 RepID=UPI001F25A8B3|nr:hypothetical protein [Mycobacterium lepromatosis]